MIGKLLSNNLINLEMFDETKEFLARYGVDLAEIEEEENEPSLGNGGLGRPAAWPPASWIPLPLWVFAAAAQA